MDQNIAASETGFRCTTKVKILSLLGVYLLYLILQTCAYYWAHQIAEEKCKISFSTLGGVTAKDCSVSWLLPILAVVMVIVWVLASSPFVTNKGEALIYLSIPVAGIHIIYYFYVAVTLLFAHADGTMILVSFAAAAFWMAFLYLFSNILEDDDGSLEEFNKQSQGERAPAQAAEQYSPPTV